MKQLVFAVIACGLISNSAHAQDQKITEEVRQFAESVKQHLQQQQAAVTEEFKATRELLTKLSADVAVQSHSTQVLQGRVQELQREVSRITLENARLKRLVTEQTAQLRQELAQERKIRANKDAALGNAVTGVIDNIPRAAPTQSSNHSVRHYRVENGDTLGAIARAFDTSVSSIKQANNLKSSTIRVGQKLVIP